MKQGAPGPSDVGKLTRDLAYPAQRSSKLIDEPIDKRGIPRPVPCLSVRDIRLGGGADG